LNEKKKFLENRVQENKRVELDIQTAERVIANKREENKAIHENINNLTADVEILKNQLSAFASNLQQKRNRYNQLSEELLRKKQRLNNSKKKFQS